MDKPTPTSLRPDYGIDAPGVVRNLLVIGSIGVIVCVVSLLLPRTDWPRLLTRLSAQVAVPRLAMGGYMYVSAKYGKVREREWLLGLLPGGWRGDERVLDVGCGLGVMLIGAAKRLKTGTAVGIDIWQTEDLSGNSPDAALENAQREGVADRVAVRTADMRQIPFPDGHFDVIVSNAAIHNLSRAQERAAAVREIARVLKPGGCCILADVRHEGEYAGVLRENGVSDLKRRDASLASLVFLVVSLGRVRPFVLVGVKAVAVA